MRIDSMKATWMIRFSVAIAATFFVSCGGGGHEEAAPAASSSAAEESHEADAPEAAEAGDYEVVEVADGGTIVGRVTFSGDAPEGDDIEITKDNNTCGEEKTILNVKVGAEGGLADAVVWIAGINSGKGWDDGGGDINQENCEYAPHVQTIAAGEKLKITNSDAVLHNIHAYSGGDTLFNIAQPNGAPAIPKKMKQAGPVELKCDVHSWMHAWVFVSPHPYHQVTMEDGKFSLADVPPGTYNVKVWHEELGETDGSVTIEAGAEGTVDFVFGA